MTYLMSNSDSSKKDTSKIFREVVMKIQKKKKIARMNENNICYYEGKCKRTFLKIEKNIDYMMNRRYKQIF